jgi:hypothetical protein
MKITTASLIRAEMQKAGEDGRTFKVTFVKRTTNEVREMVCQLKQFAISYMFGGSLAYNPKNYDLLGVWDVQKQGFRSVDCRTVISIESEFLSGVLNSELKASA